MSDGIQVTSYHGTTVEVFPIAQCVTCGWSPHKAGAEGSLTCEPCRVREVARQAALYGPHTREAS